MHAHMGNSEQDEKQVGKENPDNFKQVSKLLHAKKILPLLPSQQKTGLYVHKSQSGYDNSLLIVPKGTDIEIFELTHELKEKKRGKKIILGQGASGSIVREAINLKTGKQVAVKAFRMYAKKPQMFFKTPGEASKELAQWQLSQKINMYLPHAFVTLYHMCIAGDKSNLVTEQNPTPKNSVFYIITEKCLCTVDNFIKNKTVTLDQIENIIKQLFIKFHKLNLRGYTYTDFHLNNVLLTSTGEVVFCDPESIASRATYAGDLCVPMEDALSNLFYSLGNRFLINLEEDPESETISELLKKLVTAKHYKPKEITDQVDALLMVVSKKIAEVESAKASQLGKFAHHPQLPLAAVVALNDALPPSPQLSPLQQN